MEIQLNADKDYVDGQRNNVNNLTKQNVDLLVENRRLKSRVDELERKLKNAEDRYKILYFDFVDDKRQTQFILKQINKYWDELNRLYKEVADNYFNSNDIDYGKLDIQS